MKVTGVVLPGFCIFRKVGENLMWRTGFWCLIVYLGSAVSTWAGDDFLTNPSALERDPRFGNDRIYLVEDIEERIKGFDSIMVDEPVIFLAPDSPYGGFKASDMSALAAMLRQSFIEGLTSEPVTIGHFSVVEEPGPSVLYLRMAMKNVYIKKKKRGLLGYTPVGAVAKGVSDATKEAIDKSTLVEMTIEAELHVSTTSETLAAMALDRGQRKARGQKEIAAEWTMSGEIVHTLGRRFACRLDNAIVPAEEARDCIGEIPFGN
jgi:hypothetical protein